MSSPIQKLASWFVAAGIIFLAQETLSRAAAASASDASPGAPEVITVAKDASQLELLAANEVRRYVYLRTGKLMQLKKSAKAGAAKITVASRNRANYREFWQDLTAQQFRLKTVQVNGVKTWWIVGGDDIGALYGAYRFAEKLGVHFGLDEDALPDKPLSEDWPDLDETARPRFALRGLQPFHDFSVGPDWWNLQDYQSVLSQMAKLRMNFIGLHTYPSWNSAAGPEANVWIGLPEDVDAKGNVKSAYEAGVVTTRHGWNVKPYPTSNYAAGASLLFENDDYGPDFMLDSLDWPKTEEACVAMFNRYGDLQQKAFTQARRLGIKNCIGTEIPLGVPQMLTARLEAKGLNPADPEVIRRLYEGAFLRLQRKMPIDYYWFWIPEVWMTKQPGSKGWEVASAANVERDLGLIEAAAKSVQAPFGLATCGWRLGTRDDAFWADKRTPKNWAISSINVNLGRDPVEKQYGEIAGRSKWAIGWAEDDGSAGANCCTCLDLQLWVKRMFRDSADAFKYGCDGMMAIHWRTAAMAPNITALAQAGWTFDAATGNEQLPSPLSQTNANKAGAALDAFWTKWGQGMFGGAAGAEAVRLMQKLDETHPAINALYNANTTDKQIAELFAPLQEMESLRPRIAGAASLERYDYWLNLIRATRARAQTWVLSNRLARKISEARTINEEAAKQKFVRDQVLPLRLAVARRHEETIVDFVNCAKSSGEVGAIAHLEYGVREALVSSHDAEIKQMLGEPLPAETAVSTAYCGKPRIFMSAKCAQMNAGEPQELRPFVLSSAKCAGVTLYWRSLGHGAFKKAVAEHRSRQAYRVKLPAQTQGAVEYYLEAALDDGQKVLWPATAPRINQTVIAW